MKIFTKASFLLLTLFIAIAVQAEEANIIPGQFLIKLKESAKTQKNALISQVKATAIKSYPTLGIELWEINNSNGKIAVMELIEQYKNHPDVEFIEPNYLWEAIGGTEPNDPHFNKQWGLHNTGQNNGTIDADIDAPEAYCMPISAIDVVVGIIDTGIDYTHEDLAPNIWQNLGEDADGDGKVLIQIGDTWVFDPDDQNGIDDDGNGYIDDFVGWDFVYNDNDPMDLNAHGTHVAGIAGAIMNNNIGISGTTPNAKLAALKFLGDDGKGSTADALDALNYAVAMGMPVSNNSWGGGFYSIAFKQALKNAEANNHLFIAAAGNGGNDGIGDNNDIYHHYPSSYTNDNVISVASTDNNNNLSSFSNYGLSSVDICAPGSRIYSCVLNNEYDYLSGTSMATPFVAAVTAFLFGANPGNNFSTIKNAILNSAYPISALSNVCLSGGRLNMHNALAYLDAPANACDTESIQTCNRTTDSLALVALYNAFSNITEITNWDLQIPISEWEGIVLDKDSCVKRIRLWNAGLTGSLPSEIGNFSRIEALRFDGTQFFDGPIPPEIGNLETLEWFEIAIPNNSEQIPEEIYQLSNLKVLSLYGPFTGTISSNIENLSKLEELRIVAGFNNRNLINITGEIPAEIGLLTKLKVLDFAYQTFNGGIPLEFSNLVNLQHLGLRGNHLSGNINWLGDLVSLESIDILDNQFNGNIPSSIGGLEYLKNLMLGGNNISGIIPEEICNCYSLESFVIANTDISGTIPECIGQLNKMNVMWLYGSQLTGNIPVEIGFLTELKSLLLQDNLFEGSIPPTFENLVKLQSFSVYNNSLSGCFPTQLVSLCRDDLNRAC